MWESIRIRGERELESTYYRVTQCFCVSSNENKESGRPPIEALLLRCYDKNGLKTEVIIDKCGIVPKGKDTIVFVLLKKIDGQEEHYKGVIVLESEHRFFLRKDQTCRYRFFPQRAYESQEGKWKSL